MYSALLTLHSLMRWMVLASLLIALYRAYSGWLAGKNFNRIDNAVRHWTATIAHIQLVLGLWLYFISPVIRYFFQNFHDAVHQREVRFFGMEHSLMMVAAIVVLTIGSAKAKRAATDRAKFKTMAVWYTIAIVIILTSIPWGFSLFVHRPLFRAL